ncbi:MAG: PTS fructose transporter subunit IIA [Clostridiales bacterium]|jgi:PTS system N-acetylgalactosamine-specific IIA component|nr:PTS fructose transporter subunit IIA [Clostridiales bacterium]
MVGFLITGHGQFATGVVSAIELVAGASEQVKGVDFLESHSTGDLKLNLLGAINGLLKVSDSVLILADLVGGSPYNQSVMVKAENPNLKLEVISGANLPIALAGIFESGGLEAEELAKGLIEKGRDGINLFMRPLKNKKNNIEDNKEKMEGDGI